MHFIRFALALFAAPALAKKPPPAPPPLPPLVLDAAAPIVTVSIDGQPLRLRVDPGADRHVEINASAAQRLGLANPARLVGGKPVDLGHSTTQVGKVRTVEDSSGELLGYQGRIIPMTLAWPKADLFAGADGIINPRYLPHESIRIVRRAATAADATTILPMRWSSERGLLGTHPAAGKDIDIIIQPSAPVTLATAAAASLLARDHGGTLTGPARTLPIGHGVSRPVRDVVFARPVAVAGVPVKKVATRVFDWSGKTDIPDADLGPGEAVVKSSAGQQRQWAKLTLGADLLAACAEIGFMPEPLAITLVCPALPPG